MANLHVSTRPAPAARSVDATTGPPDHRRGDADHGSRLFAVGASPPSPTETTETNTAIPSTLTPTPRVLATPGELITSGPGISPHPIRVTTDAERTVPIIVTTDAERTVPIIVTVERDGRTLSEESHSIPPGDVERTIAGFTRETLPAPEQSVQ